MINVSKLCVEMLQNTNSNVAIFPIRGLLQTGYFAQEGVLFIHHDSFSDIEHLLHIARNDNHTNILSDFCIQFTEITDDVFKKNPLAIFSFDKNEYNVKTKNHHEDLELLTLLSEKVFNSLNIIRFIHCAHHVPEQLPFMPGYWKNSNGFMGALLVTNNSVRIIAGRRGGATIAGGLGIGLEACKNHGLSDHDYIFLLNRNNPKLGEVGRNTRQALHILNKAMYANDETLKFIMLMALFEYLATGSTYTNFKKVRPKIQAHIAKNRDEYENLTEKFKQFTSNKDSTGRQTGYRTRIIHEGATLEEIIPSLNERKRLFEELFGYAEKVIKDMIKNSYISFDLLQQKRKNKLLKIGIKT